MAHIPSLTPEAIAERKTWRYKTLAYARTHDRQIGLVLIALMGQFKRPPCYHPAGLKIDAAGVVHALSKPSEFESWRGVVLYNAVAEMVAAFRKLADDCRLTDVERVALFDELRKWVVEDKRARSEI